MLPNDIGRTSCDRVNGFIGKYTHLIKIFQFVLWQNSSFSLNSPILINFITFGRSACASLVVTLEFVYFYIWMNVGIVFSPIKKATAGDCPPLFKR